MTHSSISGLGGARQQLKEEEEEEEEDVATTSKHRLSIGVTAKSSRRCTVYPVHYRKIGTPATKAGSCPLFHTCDRSTAPSYVR